MIKTDKICERCGIEKPRLDFEAKIYDELMIYTSPVCNSCKGTDIKNPLAVAKQEYFVAVEMLVVLGFGSRKEVCEREKLQREYGMTQEMLWNKRLEREYEPDRTKILIAWYRTVAKNVHRRINRVNGVPKFKPRKARRI